MGKERPRPKSWRCSCGREISTEVRCCPVCGGRPLSAAGARVHDAHADSLYANGGIS